MGPKWETPCMAMAPGAGLGAGVPGYVPDPIPRNDYLFRLCRVSGLVRPKPRSAANPLIALVLLRGVHFERHTHCVRIVNLALYGCARVRGKLKPEGLRQR